MGLGRRTLLEVEAESRGPLERASALVELGRFDEAEAELERGEARDPVWASRVASLAWARGDFVRALRLLETQAPGAAAERARVLVTLGRFEEALALVGEADEPAQLLARAAVHVAAGEPRPAALALPADPAASSPETVAMLLARAEVALVRGEVAILEGRSREALASLRRARDIGLRSGSVSLLGRAWSRLGEAHADAGNRWRALRSVTHSLDLAGQGRLARAWLPGIHLRAFQVYGMFHHSALAESALNAGHHLVVQLASGIEERALRESFLIDNRDCQRVVGIWKGEASWGLDVPRRS